MDYFNLSRLIRNVVYNFMRMFKYLSYCLIAVCFIAVCLLLMTTKSECATVEYYYDYSNKELVVVGSSGTVYNYGFPLTNEYIVSGSSYSGYLPSDVSNLNYQFIFQNNYTGAVYLIASEYELIVTSNGVCIKSGAPSNSSMYLCTYGFTNGGYWRCESWNVKTYGQYFDLFSSSNNSLIYYATYDVYDISGDLVWSVPFTPPSFMPPSFDDSLQYLQTGDFIAFQIDPGSVPKTDTMYFQVYEIINGEDSLLVEYNLNNHSSFYLDNNPWNVSNADYSYIMTARFQSWYQIVNGKHYKVIIIFPNNGSVTSPVVYEWTMSLTAEQIEQQNQQTNADINSGIQDLNNNIDSLNSNIDNVNEGLNDINSFLNDDSYSQNNILDSMPNSDSYVNPTESGVSTIFSAFQNAFTNTSSAQSVRFVFPNSNGQYVDIPADLVSSKVPQPIIFLIQAFYWFFICRFIIKDISNTAEKAKSGEILDSSDGNIKTDLL